MNFSKISLQLIAFTILLVSSFTLVTAQTYQTVADGNWQSQGTWLNGNKPNINNKIGNNVHILISHDVTLQGKDVEINGNNNTLLEINGGKLHGNGSGMKKLIILDGTFKAINAEVEFESVENYDKLELESSCMTVFNGDFINDGGDCTFTSACLNVTNGNVGNIGNATMTGTISALNIPNGNAANTSSVWNTITNDFHVSGSITAPIANFTTSQTSAWMNAHFATCQCSVIIPSNSASNKTGLWSDPTLWTNGLPGADTDIQLNNDVTLDVDHTVNDGKTISLGSGVTLTIQSGKLLTISGILQNDGTIDGQVKIQNNSNVTMDLGDISTLELSMPGNTLTTSASSIITNKLKLTDGTINTNNNSFTLQADQNKTALVEQLNGTVSGDVTVQQYFNNSDGHHFLSTPVSGATLQELNDDINLNYSAGVPNIYMYDETDPSPDYGDGWVSPSSLNSGLTAGVGYTSWFPTTGGMTVDITGALQNGSYSIPLTYTPSNGTPPDPNSIPEGWNFIGNPYPSPINADMIQMLGAQNLANSIYIWDATSNNYSSYVNGVSSPSTFSKYIPAMQGFWVKVSAPSTLIINNSVRVTDPMIQTKALKTQFTDGLVRLQISTSNDVNETVFRFNANATDAFDDAFDAHYIKNGQAGQIEFGSLIANTIYRINSIPNLGTDSVEVPLFVTDLVGQQHSISISEMINLPTNDKVMLVDHFLSIEHDLSVSDYTYTSSNQQTSSRFSVRFVPAVVNTTTEIQDSFDETIVYMNEGRLNISNTVSRTDQMVRILNQLGQVIHSEKVAQTGQYTISLNEAKGFIFIDQGNNNVIRYFIP